MAVVGKALWLALCGTGLFVAAANAADYDDDVLRGSDSSWMTQPIVTELGVRAWYSSGKTAKKLYGAVADSTVLVSRLTYDDLDGYSGEVFGRADLEDAFMKGYFGLGRIGQGSLQDEDFEPVISPYSSTDSDQRNGDLRYGTLDIGHNLLSDPAYKLGVFVGVNYVSEELNAYGCTQTATNPYVCVPGDVASNVKAITQDAAWTSARLGMAGQVTLYDRLRLGAEAAWLPYTSFGGKDRHWLRTDINTTIPEKGDGRNGVQLEATADYRVTDDWNIGAGVRYWRMTADTHATFSAETSEGTLYSKQPEEFVTERFGAFVQSSYKFGM
jgi:hypothetical protein